MVQGVTCLALRARGRSMLRPYENTGGAPLGPRLERIQPLISLYVFLNSPFSHPLQIRRRTWADGRQTLGSLKAECDT